MVASYYTKAVCSFFCAALTTSGAFGHGGGGDIALFMTDGQVDIGFAVLDDDDITQVEFDPNDHVFQAVFTPLPPSALLYPWEIGADEPGFDSNEFDLPGNAEVSFNVLSISYWDGDGEVSFSPASGVTGGYFHPDPYFTDSQGGFHEHPFFGFSDLTDDGQPIPDGVYLTEMTVSVTGLLDSESFYLVGLIDEEVNSIYDAEGLEAATNAAAGLGEATQAYMDDPLSGAPTLGGGDFTYYADAIRYAEAIPEPASAAMLAATVTFAVWRRR